jgi:hypothetical protein
MSGRARKKLAEVRVVAQLVALRGDADLEYGQETECTGWWVRLWDGRTNSVRCRHGLPRKVLAVVAAAMLEEMNAS